MCLGLCAWVDWKYLWKRARIVQEIVALVPTRFHSCAYGRKLKLKKKLLEKQFHTKYFTLQTLIKIYHHTKEWPNSILSFFCFFFWKYLCCTIYLTVCSLLLIFSFLMVIALIVSFFFSSCFLDLYSLSFSCFCLLHFQLFLKSFLKCLFLFFGPIWNSIFYFLIF